MIFSGKFRSSCAVAGIVAVTVLAAGCTSNEPDSSEKSTSVNDNGVDSSGGSDRPESDEYLACVKSASDYLYSMIPNLSRAEAIERARTSPRCSPLR